MTDKPSASENAVAAAESCPSDKSSAAQKTDDSPCWRFWEKDPRRAQIQGMEKKYYLNLTPALRGKNTSLNEEDAASNPSDRASSSSAPCSTASVPLALTQLVDEWADSEQAINLQPLTKAIQTMKEKQDRLSGHLSQMAMRMHDSTAREEGVKGSLKLLNKAVTEGFDSCVTSVEQNKEGFKEIAEFVEDTQKQINTLVRDQNRTQLALLQASQKMHRQTLIMHVLVLIGMAALLALFLGK